MITVSPADVSPTALLALFACTVIMLLLFLEQINMNEMNE